MTRRTSKYVAKQKKYFSRPNAVKKRGFVPGVALASRIGLHVSRTKPITGNFFASVKAKIAERGLAFAPVAA